MRHRFSIIAAIGTRFKCAKTAGIIFLLIRSGYIPPDRWFRGKQEDLGIEIVITKFDGKVVQIRYLWDGD